ncbi:MAG: 1-acyl-sn-glycerol-3-phosphate acyltransferase [Sandaracinaceae bacterium]
MAEVASVLESMEPSGAEGAPPDGGAPGSEGAPRRRRTEKSAFLRWVHPRGVTWGANLDDYDPDHVARVLEVVGRFFGPGRYFPLDVEGLGRVPPAPTMVVSNHSGGTTVLDAWGFAVAWYRHFGVGRPIRPAAHEMLLGNRWTGPFLARLGALQADRRIAERVLRDWRHDLLVMPGGDLDVWRPFRERYRVRFGGRTGYARLALTAGVPLVPVAHAGAHHTLLVLTDGRRFAERIGLPRVARASIWPIHLSLPWGLALGPFPHLPMPVRLRYRVGDPIRPEDVGARSGEPPTARQVADVDALVRVRLQRLLDDLAEG